MFGMMRRKVKENKGDGVIRLQISTLEIVALTKRERNKERKEIGRQQLIGTGFSTE